VRFARWLVALLESGAGGLVCEQCGIEGAEFRMGKGGAVRCPACDPSGPPQTVESLFRSFGEALVLLRNYHLFSAGLNLLREEISRKLGHSPETLLQAISQKQRSLVEARQLFSVLNELAEAAEKRNLSLPLQSTDVDCERMFALFAQAGFS
jgi:hypothetical protein